jgi:tRNA(fMet)-specific endonuclease VapC
MTVAELRAGAFSAKWGPRRLAVLDDFIAEHEIVYANDALCTTWAQLRASARALGRPLSPQDAWIAATALSLRAPLATNNRRDYESIPTLRILAI